MSASEHPLLGLEALPHLLELLEQTLSSTESFWVSFGRSRSVPEVRAVLSKAALTRVVEIHRDGLTRLLEFERQFHYQLTLHLGPPERHKVIAALERLEHGRETTLAILALAGELAVPFSREALHTPSPMSPPERVRLEGDWFFPRDAYLLGVWFVELPRLELSHPPDRSQRQGGDFLALAFRRQGQVRWEVAYRFRYAGVQGRNHDLAQWFEGHHDAPEGALERDLALTAQTLAARAGGRVEYHRVQGGRTALELQWGNIKPLWARFLVW